MTLKILALIDSSTNDKTDYQLELHENAFEIYTNITEGKNGSYFETIYSHNNETNTKQL